jgi:beta-lactamase superfamily II metal-dependent hydrolase
MTIDQKLDALNKQRHAFTAFPEARIYKEPKKDSIQHLIFGDYITPPKGSDGKYLTWKKEDLKKAAGKDWIRVRSRQEEGWMRLDDMIVERPLEVNFVDIGQGDGCHLVTPDDKHFIIDAGESDNMYRFLRWRFNLGNDGPALPEFFAVISHPDEDHYKGFKYLLSNPPATLKRKIPFTKVYHNSIIQRAGSTIGSSVAHNGVNYLPEIFESHQALVNSLGPTGKKSNYEKLIQDTLSRQPGIIFEGLTKEMGKENILYQDHALELKVLGPVIEQVPIHGQTQRALRWFSDDVGKTKNGHSVVLSAAIGKMRILLGGDLNSKSADYLMSQYSGVNFEEIKKELALAKTDSQKKQWQDTLDAVITTCRNTFQSEVAKSCHHGSHDITNDFLSAVNAIATVISSGDEESFCHPRPETLGAIGKYGRGERPLIYSTELARSSPEYITIQKKDIKTDQVKQKIVSTYGMITLRTDGQNAVVAQKLEKSRSSFGEITKWQIDKIIWNDERGEFITKK